MRRRLRVFFAAAVLLAAFAGGPAAASGGSCQADLALFPGAGVSIHVELADTPPERERGLMFRKSLAPESGMLFIYETPQQVAFWMKNTLIPLDIIFIDSRGMIRHIHRRAEPLKLTSIPGNLPGDPLPERLMVLEIAGGEAARLGLKPGVVMAHPRLDQNQALAPCQ